MELWTLADQQRNKAISNNLTHLFDDLQRETQENDILNMLGIELYSEIEGDESKFSTFLDGGSFVDGSITVNFRGFRYVCCYMLYANYIKVSSMQDTFNGFMQGSPEGQQRVSGAALSSQADNYRQVAGTQYELCKKYLVASGISDNYPKKTIKSHKFSTL